VRKKAWYYRWNAETYLAFHAIRTAVLLRCSRAGMPERRALVFSTRFLRQKLTRYLRWENVRAAVRRFLHKYEKAIKEKKKWWFVIDCDVYTKIETVSVGNYVYIVRTGEREKVEGFLKSVVGELLREMS
jgi:hypothetical protein